MARRVFRDFRSEYWFHVSNQNEIPIFGDVEKSIDSYLLYTIVQGISGRTGKEAKNELKSIIKNNVDSIDTLRTLVGVTDKRMYLELSYIFNKYRKIKGSDKNILGESIYSLQKHTVSFFKHQISHGNNLILEVVVDYLLERGILSLLCILNKMNEYEISSLVENLLLPKEIQQEETKRRGHGAEQRLALFLHELGVSFIPDKRHENPMSQNDQNVDKQSFELAPRDRKKTWSMDLIIKDKDELRVFVQGLIHSSDPGQYGVNKSDETVLIKNALKKLNKKRHYKEKELWGLVDGVGFIENPENTIFKMLEQFDTFVQLKSLYKAGLKLHRMGLVSIKSIRFDMEFYSIKEAEEMFELYGSEDIEKITDTTVPKGREIPAGKAWLYV